MDERTRWVFIAGEGRSGTTLLGALIARATGGFNCGELRQLWVRRANGGHCECGVELARCAVWSEVATEVHRELGGRFMAAMQRYERLGRAANKLRFPRPGDDYVMLRAATEAAVERVTGASLFVDASKGSLDLAAALERDRPILVTHLVRDPRGVSFSWRTPKSVPPPGAETMARVPVWKTAVLWSRGNAVTERLLRRAARGPRPVEHVRVSYEELADDPDRTLAAIIDGASVDRVGDVAPGHGISGNTALYEPGPVAVDDRWTREMSRRDRLVASALTAPWLRQYGYAAWPFDGGTAS
jgi:hypothetical protein